MKVTTDVLVPLDGSALAERALDAAMAIAGCGSIALIHVVQPTEWFAMPADALVARERKQAAAHLERLAARLGKAGVTVAAHVVTGEPSACIASAARRAGVIVMASHGRTRTREWAFGSVAERILRRAKAPVLVIRGRVRSPFAIRKILVPVDESGRERAIMHVVQLLANRLGAEVVFLHVAARAAQRVSGPFLVREGDPAETIVRTAAEESADLIALTVAPKSEGRYVMFGRVAEAVLRRADRPVLVVRE